MIEDGNPAIDVYVKAACGRKALDVVVLDLRDLSSVADVFIICSGRSNRQVTAIAEYIETDLKQKGRRPRHIEGKKEGHWVLLDYGEVIIHVFYEPLRNFYDIEGLWSDAKRMYTQSLLKAKQTRPPEADAADPIIEELIE